METHSREKSYQRYVGIKDITLIHVLGSEYPLNAILHIKKYACGLVLIIYTRQKNFQRWHFMLIPIKVTFELLKRHNFLIFVSVLDLFFFIIYRYVSLRVDDGSKTSLIFQSSINCKVHQSAKCRLSEVQQHSFKTF